METPLATITSQVYQLEGLLLVLEKHDTDTPQVVVEGIKEKAAEIYQLAKTLRVPAAEPASELAPVQESCDEEQEQERTFDSGDDMPEPAQRPITVDEKLQRNISKDLRNALSINDRFRFRRELFGNSDLDMNDALDMILTMRSYDEASDYFYGELGWDRDNPDVADFMAIVSKHFA